MDHILLVEDEPTLRNSLSRCLQDTPALSVSTAATLKEAVASLDRRPPNLVVLDVDLPDGSGLDLVPELAQRGLHVPVLVITAHLQRFQQDLSDSTNIDILQKPFELAEFRRLVSRLLERGKSQHGTSAFSVADYLQLAGMARRSVILTVSEGGHAIGQVVVQDGNPRWAEDQLGAGEAAFRRLALMPRAEVSCRPVEGPFTKVNVHGSLEQLLIEAARQADEGRRHVPSKKPPISEPQRTSESSRPTLSPSPSDASIVPRMPPPSARPRATPPTKPQQRQPNTPIGLAAFQPKPGGGGTVTQEKVVTLNKSSKTSLAQLLALDPTVKAAARADRQGSVLESSGEMDAETACAVATMALRQIADATGELGFGRPSAWHVSLDNATWYVVQAREELLLMIGSVNKNPISTLKKLSKSCGVGA